MGNKPSSPSPANNTPKNNAVGDGNKGNKNPGGETEQSLMSYSLNIIGQRKSGKTSLIKRIHNNNIPLTTDPEPTIGCDLTIFRDFDSRYQKSRLVAWEFGRSALDRPVNLSPKHPIIFVVADTTTADGKEDLGRQLSLLFSRSQIKAEWCDDAPVLFVVNKCDVGAKGQRIQEFLECFEESRQEWANRGIALNWEYIVVACSARTGEGLEFIKDWLYEAPKKVTKRETRKVGEMYKLHT